MTGAEVLVSGVSTADGDASVIDDGPAARTASSILPLDQKAIRGRQPPLPRP